MAAPSGLRAEGVTRIAAFRSITQLPIIGIVKTYDANGDVYITPDFQSARAVSEAGADIIALDCTARRLTAREPWPALIHRIHTELDRPVLADIATLEDALAAERAGADAVATTLYGYTTETANQRTVSWPLVQSILANLTVPVLVEGHITHPDEVRMALQLGATAVVVGSAITRPEAMTRPICSSYTRRIETIVLALCAYFYMRRSAISWKINSLLPACKLFLFNGLRHVAVCKIFLTNQVASKYVPVKELFAPSSVRKPQPMPGLSLISLSSIAV